MDRTTARACAMKLIYEWEMGGDGGEDTLRGLLEVSPEEDDTSFVDTLSEGVKAQCEALDQMISEFLRGWTIERLSKVDLAILRLGAYELSNKTVPSAVAVNEAVELAKTYSTDKAGGFVNGVLGNLARKLEA